MKYNNYLACLVFSILLLGCSGDSAVTNQMDSRINSILSDSPVFTLMIQTLGTRYDIILNGVMVYDDDSGSGQISTSVPVNHWMRSGENTLKLVVYPDDEGAPINDGASIEVDLLVHNDGADDLQYRIGGYKFSGKEHISKSASSGYKLDAEKFKVDDNGGIIISDVLIKTDTLFDGVYEFSRTLIIPNSLPLWSFFGSNDVPNDPDLSEDDYWEISAELRDHLNIIQTNLVEGNIDQILPLFKERNDELDIAFYYAVGTMEAKLKDSFEVDIPQLDMLELSGRYVSYANEENLKLASVYRQGRGAAISGNYKEGPGSLKFPIMFRKQDDNWVITR